MVLPSPGQLFRDALEIEQPLQIVGAINALSAVQAQRAGFKAIYLSGAGVANASFALPDLGVTSLQDVLTDASRITNACKLPLLVDIDTGWGTDLTIERAVRELERIGVAAIHMEDQIAAKRCGHRPGKQLVDTAEMVARVRTACQSRIDNSLVIMARTDALHSEGIEAAISRSKAYVDAGADMIFAEAVETLDDYRRFTTEVGVPVLANVTEFGKTPAFTLQQLKDAGVQMALYPLTAFRAMNAAAKATYETIRTAGTQASILDQLQTREELYRILDYEQAEQRNNQPKPHQ